MKEEIESILYQDNKLDLIQKAVAADIKSEMTYQKENNTINYFNRDIENELKIKLLRKKRKYPINEEKMEYLSERKVLGIKYSIKDPDDINWKKKNVNYKNTPGYDILRSLAKVYPYDQIITAIIKNSLRNTNHNSKLKSMVTGLIQVNGYTCTTSMLLQIKKRLDERKKLEDEKDAISLSSGESIRDKNRYDSSSSSDSDDSSYVHLPKNDDNQTDLQSNRLLF